MKKKAFTLIKLMFLAVMMVILANTSSDSYGSPDKFDSKEIPKLTRRVTDYTNTLSQDQVNKLEGKLEQYEKQTSNQIAIVIVPSLNGKVLEEYSMAIAQGNKLGQKGKDNGLLILLSMKERKLRIEVGYGLEGVLPDGLCGRIRDNELVPNFKEGKFYKGLDNGIDKIILAIKGEYKSDGEIKIKYIGYGVLFLIWLIISGLFSLIHRAVGATVGAIIAFIVGLLFWSLAVAIVLGIIGFFVGLISRDIGSFAGDIAGTIGDSGTGGGFSGGGGGFGGGGASGSW